MRIQIASFEEMIDFIETNDLSVMQLEELVNYTIKVLYYAEGKTKSKIIQELTDYWAEWKDVREHPIILGLNDEDDVLF